MNKWILSPTLVDFNNQTAAAQSWLPNNSYTVENTASDASGNVIFYIQNSAVYLSSGVQVGSLPNVQGTFCGGNVYYGPVYEIAIVPVPGSCNRFYIIWSGYKGVCGTALCRATITVNSGGTLAISSGTLVDEAAGASSALAVTKADGSGNRSLYWVGGLKGIVKYTISASGVSAGTTLVAYTGGIGAPGYEGAEAEVDQGEKNVLWVDRSGEVFSADISVQGGTVRKYIYPKRLGSWGVEFDDSEAGFYVSTTTSTGTVSGGIHHFSDVANTTTSTLVSSTANYQKTFIEKAKDGSFYAVNKDGILGKFTGNGPATNAFGSLQVFSSGNLFSGSGSHYKLPDQIDGDNYDYFFGVNPYNLTGMAINGTPLVDMVPPPPPTFYNCLPISLATLICLVIIWARPLPCVSRA